ncbi:MAG TPA: HAMP domain-containing sensor histidine kinase [Nannocystaceae bacterium]|nr:HAMP domain-containing sensor histidine kinase [Nannocystaceae bacterium]
MRTRTTWALFAVAVAVVLGVMAGVTWAVLNLDARRLESERQAIVEELVRLSLWRLDSATTPLLSREIAEAGEPPPNGLPVGVRARFVVEADQTRVVAVQDPRAEARIRELLAAHAPALDGLERIEGEELLAEVTPPALPPQPAGEPAQLESQQVRNANEYYKRVASVQDNVNSYTSTWRAKNPEQGELSDDQVVSPSEPQPALARGMPAREMMRPLWWGDELVLVRRVVEGGSVRLEGSWIDWPALQSLLLQEIADLWPSATLVAADSSSLLDADRRLATLPVRLEVALGDVIPPVGASPLRIALAVGWLFVLLATSAVVVLLRASLALSERRAAFVSAVTHELRTPLTTFRMYTEMLGEGMVEDKRDRYVATLRREAERLGHLVENVLSYARIESDRVTRSRERMVVAELIERFGERLVERAHAGGVGLDVEIEPAAARETVSVDASAIEQILFNLVDNATKYGATDGDPRVRLAVGRSGATIELHVRDFGPGIPEDERRRIFAPFAKGRAHAAGTKPGVGLGLALSRRLAQQMGGRLELSTCQGGADFVLTLPIA